MKKIPCDKIAGVVLAAGEGRRMGKTKALLQIDGHTFLQKIVSRLKGIGCDPIVVVGGADFETVKAEARKLTVEFALNENWEAGQFSSLKAGLNSLELDHCGAVVALVDHPFVTQDTYINLIGAFTKHPHHIVIPVFEHRRGHPIVIPRAVIREVIESPESGTLKDVIGRHERMLVLHRCEDPGVINDIDTKEDLDRMLNK